jgi:hypothetical protein
VNSFTMAAANRDTPRSWPASTGSRTWITSPPGRGRFPRQPRIGQIARVAAQEVIGDAAADAVELDALPDQPRAGQGAVHVLGQHFRGQHLQLQRHRQTILRPGAVRMRMKTSPDRNTSRAARRCKPKKSVSPSASASSVQASQSACSSSFLAASAMVDEGLMPSPTTLLAKAPRRSPHSRCSGPASARGR